MFLTVDTSITIRAAPEAVWAYAYKPENWTASNPTEHFGLHFDSPDNRPHAGATFTQRESVANSAISRNGSKPPRAQTSHELFRMNTTAAQQSAPADTLKRAALLRR